MPDAGTCSDCEGRGWLVMTYSHQLPDHGTPIQRCDNCQSIPDDFEAARRYAGQHGGGRIELTINDLGSINGDIVVHSLEEPCP